MYGGPAPDALVALIRMLATLHDDSGNVVVAGLRREHLRGAGLGGERAFRRDAGVLDGVDLVADGTIADNLYARPAITVIGIDAPRVDDAASAIVPRARAAVSIPLAPGQTQGRARGMPLSRT